MFDKQPICEVCQKEPATSFSYVDKDDDTGDSAWKFVGGCMSGIETYYIEFERFFNSPPSSVDWMAHMSEKSWMKWTDFMTMMGRFRDATGSYQKL